MSAPPRDSFGESNWALHIRLRAKRAIIASQKARRFARLAQILQPQKQRLQDDNLFLYPALMRARDAHVLPVFGDRAASDLDSLGLKNPGDLLVGQRTAGIFFIDELLDAALKDQQRSVAALGALYALAEEISQLEYALRSVGILAGHSTAYGGRMHADFFGHLLDHHGFQLIDTFFQELVLAGDDGVADLGDGLLALLDVLDELDGAFVALFDVIARVLVVAVA